MGRGSLTIHDWIVRCLKNLSSTFKFELSSLAGGLMDRARAASCTPCVVDMFSRQVHMHTVCSLARVCHRVSGIVCTM